MARPITTFPALSGKDPELSRWTQAANAVFRPVAEAVANTPMLGAPPPPWINVGILPASGYVQVPTGVAPFLPKTAHHRNALSYVYGKLAVTTAAGSGPAVLFNLPTGSRPSELVSFFGGDGGGTNVWELAVHPDGDVEVISTTGAGDVVVATFTFLAER